MEIINELKKKLRRLYNCKSKDINFYDLEKIKTQLSEFFGDDNFTSALHNIILNEKDLKTWIITTNKNIYFVIDGGNEILKPIKRSKTDFKYTTNEYLNNCRYGTLLINGLYIKIIYDKNYTGETKQFESFLDNIKIINI